MTWEHSLRTPRAATVTPDGAVVPRSASGLAAAAGTATLSPVSVKPRSSLALRRQAARIASEKRPRQRAALAEKSKKCRAQQNRTCFRLPWSIWKIGYQLLSGSCAEAANLPIHQQIIPISRSSRARFGRQSVLGVKRLVEEVMELSHENRSLQKS